MSLFQLPLVNGIILPQICYTLLMYSLAMCRPLLTYEEHLHPNILSSFAGSEAKNLGLKGLKAYQENVAKQSRNYGVNGTENMTFWIKEWKHRVWHIWIARWADVHHSSVVTLVDIKISNMQILIKNVIIKWTKYKANGKICSAWKFIQAEIYEGRPTVSTTWRR